MVLKYKPSVDIPRFIKAKKSFSPTTIAQTILLERNKKVTPQSVNMWMTRNKKVITELREKLQLDGLSNEEVTASLFINGTFEKIKTVETWINDMLDRVVSPNRIKANVNVFRQICRGFYPKWGVDLVNEGFQTYLHPDRFTLEQFQRQERELRKRGFDTAGIRLTARNLLASKGIYVGTKISGSKSKGFKKFADLFIPIKALSAMLEYIRVINYQVYVADLMMFKTASRITATMNARIERYRADLKQITVIDKGRHKNPESRVKRKYIDSELAEALDKLIAGRIAGKIFSISKKAVRELNREALEKFCFELMDAPYSDDPKEGKIRDHIMPAHFWRHMFAQHMLILTEWKYAVVANMGDWTVKALEESYGKPPKSVVDAWAKKYGTELTVKVGV